MAPVGYLTLDEKGRILEANLAVAGLLGLERTHRLAVNLRPASLDRLGLMAALNQYAEEMSRQHGPSIQVETIGPARLPLAPEAETMLYRVAQEAISNAIRHSAARQIAIVSTRRQAQVVLVVEDSGWGFDVASATRLGALGLLGMREKIEMLGGSLTIESAVGTGTTVQIEVPAEASA